MSASGSPTLDQLRVLLAVVDEGGFSAAARRLNRRQSVISYTIGNLETQLGFPLFERGRRHPVLTEAGRAVLGDVRQVAMLVDELRARAGGITRGLEAEVSLAVDVMFPTDRLVAILESFARTYPTVGLRLRVEAMGAVAELVLDGSCGLGISGFIGANVDNLERQRVGVVELIPVAAPHHPLGRHPGKLTTAALRLHTQLVLSARSPLTEGRDFGVISPRTWRLGDLGAKRALLCAGLGWGSMPETAIREDLASGRLVRLAWDEIASQPYLLSVIHRTDTPPGPAGRWLATEIAAHLAACPENAAGGKITPRDPAPCGRGQGEGFGPRQWFGPVV